MDRENTYARIQFEHNYNSCNWGYIADFEITDINGQLFFFSMVTDKKGVPCLSFFEHDKPLGFEALRYENKSKIENPIFINCTGNDKWCNDGTIEEIVKNHKEY